MKLLALFEALSRRDFLRRSAGAVASVATPGIGKALNAVTGGLSAGVGQLAARKMVRGVVSMSAGNDWDGDGIAATLRRAAASFNFIKRLTGSEVCSSFGGDYTNWRSRIKNPAPLVNALRNNKRFQLQPVQYDGDYEFLDTTTGEWLHVQEDHDGCVGWDSDDMDDTPVVNPIEYIWNSSLQHMPWACGKLKPEDRQLLQANGISPQELDEYDRDVERYEEEERQHEIESRSNNHRTKYGETTPDPDVDGVRDHRAINPELQDRSMFDESFSQQLANIVL